jgi:hypothetical protein
MAVIFLLWCAGKYHWSRWQFVAILVLVALTIRELNATMAFIDTDPLGARPRIRLQFQ